MNGLLSGLFGIRQKRQKIKTNIVFFSFAESDRNTVLALKTSAMNPTYPNLNFMVQDLMIRSKTKDRSVVREAISRSIEGVSRIVVFVGKDTHKSIWVAEEVKLTLSTGKPVYAIRLKDTHSVTPVYLSANNIYIYPWHEENLQYLATRET